MLVHWIRDPLHGARWRVKQASSVTAHRGFQSIDLNCFLLASFLIAIPQNNNRGAQSTEFREALDDVEDLLTR